MRISHENRPTGIRAATPVDDAGEPDVPGTTTPPDLFAALVVAPHVAAHLARRLKNDSEAIGQTARALSEGQLRGTAALPDPLPLVPAVTDEWGESIAALDDDCRRALLIACVSVSRRTDTLLAATGLTVAQVVEEPLSRFLTLVSGHFVVVDPRIRCVVHESATLAERTTAHARLARALRDSGREPLAAWHAALATLAGDSLLVPELLALSRAALRRGDSIWAFHVAREAASQADGADRARADLAAGISALHSGYLDDAVYSLGRVARCGTAGLVRRALAPYAVAVTLSTGYVPDAEIAEHETATSLELARTGVAPAGSEGVVAALATAAALHAERGERDAALDALHRGERLAGATAISGSTPTARASGFLAVARSWCTAFGVELPAAGQPADQATIEPRWLAGYLVASTSITLARAGHITLAESTLSAARLRLSRDTARAVDSGPEVAATPLLAAHLDCAAALVAVIAGKYSSAADRLERAALDGPVELVFGQLAITAASRMRVLMTGTTSAAVRASTGLAGAPAHRRAALVDRAFAHAFAGRPQEAAPLMALANELAANRVELLLPEPDEVVLWAAAAQPQAAETARRNLVRNGVVTGDDPDSGTSWLTSLRATLELGSAHEVARLRGAAAETCRGLASVYERAQTELVLSRALTRAGDPDSARTHAVAAIELFFQTGANALVTHARDLLAASAASAAGEGSSTAGDWARELTDREREVASLVVLGTSNRDVARHLHLSVRTIEVHLARVFTKLDVHSRTELSYRVHGSRTRGEGLRDDHA